MIRRIGADEGESLVDQRKALRVTDPAGAVLGYQMCQPETQRTPDATVISSAGVTRGEWEAFLGFFGQSRTARLNEPQREARVKAGLLPEDWLERAQGKVACYAATH